MFFTGGVVFVLAGDDVFALLICDEDLEYGARRSGSFGCIFCGFFLGGKVSYLWIWGSILGETSCHGLQFNGIRVETLRQRIR